MKLFDVYSLFEIEPIRGKGCFVYDKDDTQYLDFYGGHAVISIGHSHPHYVSKIKEQIEKIGFYSNSVENSLQLELATKMGAHLPDNVYELFLCNSGAEANENAIKMASFRKPNCTAFITLKNGFHGRTSAAVNLTDNTKIQASVNKLIFNHVFDFTDIDGIKDLLKRENICAVMLEPIQGVGGLDTISIPFLQELSEACKKHDTTLIMDEVQAGYGRSGKFFAHQHADIEVDIITIAKGMGNGFPIGGVLLNKNSFEAKSGLLGTTFGGNHLACAAGIAVLDVIKEEKLLDNAATLGETLKDKLVALPDVQRTKGKGLMVGLEMPYPIANLRKHLLYEHKVFTGNAKNPNVLRLLPPLNISAEDINLFVGRLELAIKQNNK